MAEKRFATIDFPLSRLYYHGSLTPSSFSFGAADGVVDIFSINYIPLLNTARGFGVLVDWG